MEGKKQKSGLWLLLLDVLAILDVVWTIYLGNFASWTLYNLSVVGYWYGHAWELRIWGWLTALLFVSFLLYLYQLYEYRNRALRIVAMAAGVILSVGVVIPYQMPPLETSWISNLHIACSLLAPLCLVASIAGLILHGLRRGWRGFGCFLALMVVLLAGAAVLFVKYTIITTVLELYTVVCISLFLTALVLWKRTIDL